MCTIARQFLEKNYFKVVEFTDVIPVVNECGTIIGSLISIVSGFRTHKSIYVKFTQLINLLLALLRGTLLLTVVMCVCVYV